MSGPAPFKIAVSDHLLAFIKQRVESARIPPGYDLPKAEAWSLGIPPSSVTELRDYWATKYDWRAVEAGLNARLKMFTLPVEEAGERLSMHFVHHRSERPNAIPLLFQHGWPGSFLEVEPLIDLLTTPADPTQQAYHVVAPSLPGFAFSSLPRNPNFLLKQMAAVDHQIMLALGYSKYMVQGGDWGSMIARQLGIDFPSACLGVHVNMVVGEAPSALWQPVQFARLMAWAPFQGEKTAFGRLLWWRKEESGYLEIQGTKPQTISYALTDSPIGMLAWIRDKIYHLVDDDFTWEPETVITWAMMYIIQGSPGPANIYRSAKGSTMEQTKRDLFSKVVPGNVAFGSSYFPKDVCYIPRWWAACTVATNIVFWREHTKGGHFPSVECPAQLAQDIRDFTQLISAKSLADLQAAGAMSTETA